MLDLDEVKLAVALQAQSYQLLKWLGTAINRGFIKFDRAHEYLDAADAARDWLEVHFHNLPEAGRPERGTLDAFARFFATYLTTSFDLVAQPKVVLESPCGCF